MTWRDFYPKLLEKNSKSDCLVFSQRCFERSAQQTSDLFIRETAELVRSNLFEANKRSQEVKRRRVLASESGPRETAHILIHLIEVAISNNPVSAAGHAARCAEALYRIDPSAPMLQWIQ